MSASESEKQRVTGKVKWFNDQKGFGFITTDEGGGDLFVHQSSIRSDGFRSLALGESVEFLVDSDPEGRTKAVDVTGPDQAPVQGTRGAGGGRPAYGGAARGGRPGYGGGGYGGYGGGGGGGGCYKCGETGHIARDCSQGGGGRYGGSGGGGGSCYNCGESGHFARDCPSNGR